MRHGYAYNKHWLDYAGPVSRATAYAYWLQAKTFEQRTRERGDVAMVNYQKRIRLEYQNRLIEWDATEGGNI